MDIDTILSDEERELAATSSESEHEEEELKAAVPPKKSTSKKGTAKAATTAAAAAPKSIFGEFESSAAARDERNAGHSWDFKDAIESIKKDGKSDGKQSTLDEKIRQAVEARQRRDARKNGDDGDEEDDAHAGSDASESEGEEGEKEDETRPLVQSGIIKDLEKRQIMKAARVTSFAELQLSRPLLRAVQALNFASPTPIQADAVPLILQGKDILASAVTGSGKTAAYLLPVLERLLLRDRRSGPLTRVLIVVPTRELAQQVSSMLEKLGQFCEDVTQAVVVGGLSMPTQASAIRARPDVIICTPGRLIDHLRNTVSFDLGDLEILILDEADRLLELGFLEELREIIRYAPKQRQTMLFSATMTSDVTKLAELSLQDPSKVATDPLFDVAQRLVQEFVRVRSVQSASLNEKELVEEQTRRREALLYSLCTKTATSRVIIFFQHKHQAHRTCIAFGLLGLRCAELHGNLTQAKRLEALQRFRDGEVDFLFCTDLAARGIDISGVQCVINFELPKDLTTYVHRVGRTARAGRGGRAISLVGDERRGTMKELLRSSSSSQFQSRTIATSSATKAYEKLKAVQRDIQVILDQERVEREMRLAEMDATKAENLVVHRDEIMARPRKTWFLSEGEKRDLKQQAKETFEGDGSFKSQKVDQTEGDDQGLNAEKKDRLGNRAKRRRTALREAEEREAKRAVKELKRASATSEEDGDKPLDESAKKRLREALVPPELKQRVAARQAKKKLRIGAPSVDEDGDLVDLDKTSSRKARALGSGGRGANFVEKRSRDADDETEFKAKSLASKLRKGGKKSVHSFKSKAKYKRR